MRDSGARRRGSRDRRRGAARLRSSLVVAMALVASVSIGYAAPAGAAATWSVVPSASPAAAPSGDFKDVACPSDTSCFAVGDYLNGAGFHLLAEHWDGTSWSVMPMPYTGGFLQKIACSSPTSCMAVGGAGTAMHAALWNGSTWSIVPFADAGTGTAVFAESVACATDTSCVAVGGRGGGNSPLSTFIEQWDGAAWSLAASPNVPGADNQLNGVSCSSDSSCFAVGSVSNDIPAPVTLIEQWDGDSWSIVDSPNPDGDGTPSLAAVSCSSDSSCFATGSVSDGVSQTLIEQWDGDSWSIVDSPSLASGLNRLSSVSCSSDTNCFAVGDVIERWDGVTWSIAAGSTLDPKFSAFGSVDCTSDTSCFALASGASSHVVLEHWNGSKWSAATGPLPTVATSNTALASVSCATPTTCFAVGQSINAAGNVVPLIERPVGAAWSAVAGPSTAGNTLAGVSCPSATMCFAVGTQMAGAIPRTLIERWNGTKWSVMPSPNVTRAVKGLTPNRLLAVSCSSTTSCFAVGSSIYFSVRTVIEQWDGKSWTIVQSPNLSASKTAQSILVSVSCVSSTSCVAVGRSSAVESNQPSTFRTLTERWNGSAWTIVASPNAASGVGELAGVSCSGAKVCVAVGDAYRFSLRQTIIETWNGKTWTRVASADPAPATHSALAGVSCVSPTSCVAVGGTGPTATLVKTLAGGHWTNGSAVTPTGANSAMLDAVSCTSTRGCTAVGTYDTNGSLLTLVERRS